MAPFSLAPLTIRTDDRGQLVRLEETHPLPFEPKRMFFIRKVPAGKSRAGHAVSCEEFLVAVAGSCKVTVRSKALSRTINLDADSGLYLSPGCWVQLTDFSPDCVLLVACSETFDNTTYYDEPQI